MALAQSKLSPPGPLYR